VSSQIPAMVAKRSNPAYEQPRTAGVELSLVTDTTGGADPGQPDDDAVLVQRLVSGDGEALAALYDRHGQACYGLARKITANDTLAEDAVQEAFLGMWRTPAAYQRGRGTVRTWLLGLTHHKAVDLVRRETAQQRRQSAHAAQQAFDPPPDSDPAIAVWQGARAAQVRSALGDLPDTQREALALAYFGGYTQTEIAKLTGVPLGTVKTRTFAAMRRLRMRLAPLATLPEEG
jgi:RNA polymerase sigma factor (sigma-70 family)